MIPRKIKQQFQEHVIEPNKRLLEGLRRDRGGRSTGKYIKDTARMIRDLMRQERRGTVIRLPKKKGRKKRKRTK